MKKLVVGGNQISDLSPLQHLAQLQQLNCSWSQISDLSPLQHLAQLQQLNCSSNQISDLSPLQHLAQLQQLDCSENQISDLSPVQSLVEKGLQVEWWIFPLRGDINVYDNPLQYPPVEVVLEGNAAILEYFRQREKTGSRPLLEAKLILLGDGRAGKTSLACRLLGRELPGEPDRTEGVDVLVEKYAFPIEKGEFLLHIWDFAGQDKYKPLHQFFYSEDALYVLVADSGNAQTDFADWFETAKLFGKGSPLLVVLNEFREGIGMGASDEVRWRREFPTLIKEVRLVNLKTLKGWETLERDIRHYASQLPHVGKEYPNNWADIRAELERRRDKNHVISLQEYLNICRDHDLLERSNALILSGVLHRIGVCLHYQHNETLRQHVILKNEWATDAVYQILKDKVVEEQKKVFRLVRPAPHLGKRQVRRYAPTAAGPDVRI
ncbi:MAG: leucine-rich repeat domain-containing protein [Saprospiraceae bacterium]|nr:leucine-rich repeat domain-containing protein [Saprospiraceae bacterium]MDW8485062.1 COR domain-containing protein [Saprospiraceae bacterium]